MTTISIYTFSSVKRSFLFFAVFVTLSAALRAQIISPASGFYQDSVLVTISDLPAAYRAFYTVDGTTPNSGSEEYVAPFSVKQTSSLRVAFVPDEAGNTLYDYRVFLIDEPTELAVMTLTTDPDNFFSDETGIYVTGTNGVPGYCSNEPRNWNQEEWERPVHLEFFEKDRSKGFTIDAGVRIGGGCTRLYDQKTLHLYFRKKEYGSNLKYKLFEDKPIDKFKRLVLRNGGQDWYRAMVRNEVIQSITRKTMDLGYQAYKPVVVFLNGQYWGIHTLMEKKNEDFLESNYGFDADSIDILNNKNTVSEGTSDHYDAMVDFLNTHDLSVQENFDWVAEQMNVDQFMDYQITEIFMANGDWPANNIRFWRPRVPGSKWQWILFDMDMAMDVHTNGRTDSNSLYIATSPNNDYSTNPSWATLVLRKLLENEGFKNDFIQRYNVHMQTTFEKNGMQAVVDSVAALIESEIPAHMAQWQKSLRLGGTDWEGHMDIIRNFIQYRESNARSHLQQKFNLGTRSKLNFTIEPEGSGTILVEDQPINAQKGVALYNGIPAVLKVIPAPGYSFAGWEGGVTADNGKNTITLAGKNITVTAHFTRNEISETNVVINEVNYKSAADFETGDWVEFYNNSGSDIDISNWYFSDEKDSHKFVFPEGTILNSGGYLVLSEDTVAFKTYFPAVTNVIGNMDFGLSSDGELIRLFNNAGEIADSLTYGNSTPWPSEPNGTGATLALLNPGFDRTDGNNWNASYNGGTPGGLNTDVYVHNEPEKPMEVPARISLEQNYPNPFNPVTTINYTIGFNSRVTLTVYDIMGRKVSVLVNEPKAAGTYSIIWDAGKGTVASGIYFYTLEAAGTTLTRKLTLVK